MISRGKENGRLLTDARARTENDVLYSVLKFYARTLAVKKNMRNSVAVMCILIPQKNGNLRC